MARQNIYLGRLFGIPVDVDYSWFFIFILLTWMLAVSYFPAEFKQWPTYLYWVAGSVTSLMLFVSVLLHELGHSLVALRYRIPVREITLFVFGGVSKIAGEPPGALAEFWIAIAGPLVSFLLGIFFFLIQPLVAGTDVVYSVVKYLAYINIILAVFNLVPGFPLDGGRVFRAIVWGITHNMRKATFIAGNVGRVFAFLMIYLGVMEIFSGRIADGLWIIFIAWFLESAASAQIQQQKLRDILTPHKVSEAMIRNFAVVPSDTTLKEVMDYHVIGSGRRTAIVQEGDREVGLITLHHLRDIPVEEWSTKKVREVMLPLNESQIVSPTSNLWSALEKMDVGGVNQLPVVEDGRVIGMLTRESLIGFLQALDREIR